mgnify:CR=1 FL=1
MAGMQAAAKQFPGHMEGFLITLEQGEEGCYRMLFAVWLYPSKENRA